MAPKALLLFPATHSGAISNASGAALGTALDINATQWHETPPQTPDFVNAVHQISSSTIHLPSAINAPIIEAPHPMVPIHTIVTGNPVTPLYHFNKKMFL